MEKKEKNSTMKSNLYFLRLIHRASPGRIPMAMTVVFFKSVSNFLFDVYLIRYIVNGLQTGLSFRSTALFLLAVAGYHALVCLLENYYTEIFVPSSDLAISGYLHKLVFAKAKEVELACFENPAFYNKYVKATGELAKRSGQLLSTVTSIVRCVFLLLATSFLIFVIDPLLIVFAVLPTVMNLLLGKYQNNLRHEHSVKMKESGRTRDYVNRTFYLADYAKEMRLTQLYKVMFRRLDETIKEMKAQIDKDGFRLACFGYLFMAVSDIVVYLGTILYAAFRTLVSGTMLFGDCVVVINTINSTMQAMQAMSGILVRFQGHALYINDLRHFLEHESTIPDVETAADAPRKASLSLNHVSFCYDGQTKNALSDINLTLRHGEKVALVGHNGAGKTTLIKLILRLYDPTEGEVTLSDIPIKDLRLGSYRERFGAVFQDYRVFSLSVTDNVLLKGNITDEERVIALNGMEKSGILPKVETLPFGADTVLTKEFDSNGAVLSGGECQKIAIARVFAKDCEFIIMDEPTSALDPIAEYEMYEAMKEVCRDKTVIFISHRLSSATLADRVYLMEEGRIAEEGTHAELLEKNGKYADMWRKQAEKYAEEATIR